MLAWLVGYAAALNVSLLPTSPNGVVAPICLGNGFMVAALLRTPRDRWFPLVVGSNLIALASLLPRGAPPELAILIVLANDISFVVSALVLSRDRAWVTGASDSLASWLRFVGWAVLGAPLMASLLGVGVAVATGIVEPSPVVAWGLCRYWYVTDTLAVFLFVPLTLRLRFDRFTFSGRRVGEAALTLGALTTATVVVLHHLTFPALFLVIPILAFVMFRLGFAGMTVAMTALSAVILLYTAAGVGPFAVAPSTAEALLSAQVFLAAVLATMVVLAAMYHEAAGSAVFRQRGDVYETIARDTGESVFVCDAAGRTRYLSPALERLLGLPTVAAPDLPDRLNVHPDDAPLVTAALESLGRGRDEVEVIARAAHLNGSWLSLEARLRRTRPDGGSAPLVVGVVRDVTARLRRERELAELAATDVLTGLLNRRGFDDRCALEWERATLEGTSLGLVVVDIDWFKAYNDRLGHQAGDRCIAAIARALRATVRRHGDCCGRYGGEEFVALLPDTDEDGALDVAEMMREAVRAERLDHPGNPAGVVTVSVGVAALVPSPDRSFAELFADADAALYRAKAEGRDRVLGATVH